MKLGQGKSATPAVPDDLRRCIDVRRSAKSSRKAERESCAADALNFSAARLVAPRENARERGLIFSKAPYEALMAAIMRPDELGKCFQCGFRNVVFDALCVGFGRFGGNPYRAEEVDNESVTKVDPLGQRVALFS